MSGFFETSKLLSEWKSGSKLYHEFLRVPAMSAGLYVLQPGSIDMQTPHKEDEIYYVLKGRAQMVAGDQEKLVTEGSIIFIKAGQEHRFRDIEQELQLLVIFGPAEK